MKPHHASMLFVLPVLLTALSVPAPAEPNNEQGEVREQRKAGNVRSLRQIEQLILPRMKGKQYLGPEYDPVAMAYRLKFIKDGKVEFVDVDARTARILNHSR
ncbi:MAG: hypothetical protein KDE32_12940 [Novosphingobium sp.]|nr:hypothetical protein [Novosphingobium sp.]